METESSQPYSEVPAILSLSWANSIQSPPPPTTRRSIGITSNKHKYLASTLWEAKIFGFILQYLMEKNSLVP